MNKWGKYIYNTYLLHPVMLTLLYVGIRPLHFSKTGFPHSIIFAVVGFVLTLLLSRMSYMLCESRFLKLKDKFTTIVSHE